METENIQTNFKNYIWLSDVDIEKFIIEIEALDKYRTGQAVLESMSPGELKLIVQPIDSQGNLSVTLHFKKEDRINKDYPYEIKVEFQIDPTSLPTVRKEFFELTK